MYIGFLDFRSLGWVFNGTSRFCMSGDGCYDREHIGLGHPIHSTKFLAVKLNSLKRVDLGFGCNGFNTDSSRVKWKYIGCESKL